MLFSATDQQRPRLRVSDWTEDQDELFTHRTRRARVPRLPLQTHLRRDAAGDPHRQRTVRQVRRVISDLRE